MKFLKDLATMFTGVYEEEITPLNVIIICAALLVALIVMVWLAV
jgi:hypothetical protein